MDERFIKFKEKLTDKLIAETHQFILENLADEENMANVLNFVLSSFLCSTFIMMKFLSSQDPHESEKVQAFKEDLMQYLSTRMEIKSYLITKGIIDVGKINFD